MTSLWLMSCVLLVPPVAFEGAEGFGASSQGGTGGRMLVVDRLDDDPTAPSPGSLRWAAQQDGPRIVTFSVSGTIQLQDELVVKSPFLTIDGSTAPDLGVCIAGGSFVCNDTHDIIVRHVRFRRGDVDVIQKVLAEGRDRPKGSGNLDCVSLNNSKDLIFDHCSLSWCCDELFCVVRCENVTIQWCLMAEPLSNPQIHPYGNDHAFGLNLSANTLSLHHCLLAHYVMRGPQFEANDVRLTQSHDVKMESVNNVLFDYTRSGSRYTTGIEDHPDEAAGRTFSFQFINNMYINGSRKKPEIAAALRHGVIEPLRVYFAGNIGPLRTSDDLPQTTGVLLDPGSDQIVSAAEDVQHQISTQKLFSAPHAITTESTSNAYERVLNEAGAGPQRDAVDLRIVDDVRSRKFTGIVKSQADVGGWPKLTGEAAASSAVTETVARRRLEPAASKSKSK